MSNVQLEHRMSSVDTTADPSAKFDPGPIALASLGREQRVTPLTASTTLPSQSVLIPYSNFVPGSATNGAVKMTFEPDDTLGVPVTDSQRTRSAFQNQ
jgi:hypothetical protein